MKQEWGGERSGEEKGVGSQSSEKRCSQEEGEERHVIKRRSKEEADH